MKIVQLTAENVKRLKAVRIRPDGSLVQITGRNGQGKTTVLDCITYALGGKRVQPPCPVRQGEKHASVVLDLGDYVVKRTWSASGGTDLSVESPNGVKYPRPQMLLEELYNEYTFDPVAFSNMSAKEQVATLKKLAGLDFTQLDQDRQQLYDERTLINRQAKTAEAQVAPTREFIGVPDSEIDISEIVRAQAEAAQRLRENDRLRQATEAIRERIQNGHEHIEQLKSNQLKIRRENEQRIKRLAQELMEAQAAAEVQEAKSDAQIAKAQRLLDELQSEAPSATERASELVDPDMDAINARLREAEETNRRVRAKQADQKLWENAADLKRQSDALTDRIAEIDRMKERALAEAKMPVAGLGFDDNGVTLNGLPFEQASSAEQLRVSVAISLALNPKLRIPLIRDGSKLDKANLALLAELAEDQDAQVWIERVPEGQPVGVVIEDGEVLRTEISQNDHD